MAFLGSKISLFAFQFFLIFNSLKSSVKILWRSVEKRTKENEWLSMVHLPIYFLESMSGSLNVSKQIYSFVWVSFLIASSMSQSLTFLNSEAQIRYIFLFLIKLVYFPFSNWTIFLFWIDIFPFLFLFLIFSVFFSKIRYSIAVM